MSKVFEEALVENSETDTFLKAIQEWVIDGVTEGKDDNYCICGQKIKYLFTIRNKINQNQIFPVGSSCVLKCDNLVESHHEIKHKYQKPHLYCEKCGQRHKNRKPICNTCKKGNRLVKFGKHKYHSYNYIFENDFGYFGWLKRETSFFNRNMEEFLNLRKEFPILI